ncbi:pentatricopeptide repeat-containing protein At5g39350-like [Punica granatum]|uniref:Pentatricopeptide repeat-containing protein At5g39350-like n=2 Tax=Punica granatum TaxID=22663 RepID=A0A6P8BPW5_PUNGR|nr:pentatricopeptide repeat-containing protein At5g39350-like [Punica granatum]XP_031372387.1 pentatricopeptide repeat-containing protein At5g39350-like [Punica granatum]XP_031372471.1 pentatricopeptide repeat-containing protein At5g39350-like [Punica granatum]XP_031372535.1 pentatricopeptide repeat-containing protein At5g39350-like [Punica granatum]XP_031372610.1 pentatricopeptide repeat-containing protein At5g39350-like [Punica granatum]XP_031372693.1 pentatricopeptide repeat-containing prot
MSRFFFLSRHVSVGYSLRARSLSSLSSATISIYQNNERLSLQECVSLLQHLGDTGDAACGKSLHSTCVKSGFDRDVFVTNNIMRLYTRCGDLLSARRLFDGMPERNLVSWTSMLSCYVHNGQYGEGLGVYSLMCRSGVMPNEFGFSLALKACRLANDFTKGLLIHGQIIKSGFDLYKFCIASLLGIYVGYGDVEAGRTLFDSIPLGEESEALWNALLDGYVKISYIDEALRLFNQMAYSRSPPNSLTYSMLVKLCADTLNLDMGKSFHGRIAKVGLENDAVVGGSLVDCYAKLGFLDGALKAFENLEEKDNTVCCTLLSGFCQIADATKGWNCYIRFLSEGNKPDMYTLASVLCLCSYMDSRTLGSLVHCSVIKYGFELDAFLGSAIIEVYGGVGMISDAYQCFFDVRDKNEVCFGVMINNLVLNSNNERALVLFDELRNLGLIPDHSILSYILRACANLKMLLEGKSIHCCIVKDCHDSDSRLCIENALIEMYAKCGAIDCANLVLKGMERQSEFSWTNVISGYSEMGRYEEALQLFRGILYTSVSMKPTQFTLVNVLQACSKTDSPARGKQIHAYAVKQGFESHLFVQSSLINMYAASKDGIQDACQVFSSMKKRDPISWSSIITALTQNGYTEEALKVFAEFQHSPDYSVDDSTLSSCISACASLAALDVGKALHAFAVKIGFASEFHVETAIIDMYSKGGTLKDARTFFDEKRDRNLVSWTAMMSGYANHGYGKEAVKLFNEMKESGLDPDGITFVGILMACSHAGLVNEGRELFESLRNDHCSELTINHYACMVDLLGRAGNVDEAVDFIKRAPFHSKSLLWKTLLGACRKHGNVELGNQIAGMLVELEPEESSNYLLLSNIYASAEIWDSSKKVRNKLKGVKTCKQPGRSWIQVV